MSELNDILETAHGGCKIVAENVYADCNAHATQSLKQLFLDMLGGDEIMFNKPINMEAQKVIDALTRDQFRAELRKKIGEL